MAKQNPRRTTVIGDAPPLLAGWLERERRHRTLRDELARAASALREHQRRERIRRGEPEP